MEREGERERGGREREGAGRERGERVKGRALKTLWRHDKLETINYSIHLTGLSYFT